jgi:8-oxo-dGTP diphosphatase
MKNMVVGFMFSNNLEHVVLIRKKRPEWQAGKLNGIGGHVEDGETALQAMVREFEEEAGVKTLPNQWFHFGVMNGLDWCVNCFVTRVNLFDVNLVNKTDEHIEVHFIKDGYQFQDTVENLDWLIRFAVDCMADSRPCFVTVQYPS